MPLVRFLMFLRLVEGTRKNSLPQSVLLVFLLVSGKQPITTNFVIPERGISVDGRQERWRERQPEHVDCRAARPKFDKGAWWQAHVIVVDACASRA
jgi:hypothetical protein